MEPRYERNLPALTEEACQILRKKRVLVVGCGGLGGHIIDQLARIGVGFCGWWMVMCLKRPT